MNIAILSYHTCPLATLGGKDTGGMNVYVRDLTRFLGKNGIHADVFTRSQDEHVPHILHDLGFGNRVVHIPAGPEIPLPKKELVKYLPQFSQGVMNFAQQKQIKYDLIHSHYWMSGISAGLIKEGWHTPIIHMFHTLNRLKNQNKNFTENKEGKYRDQGEQKVMEIADRIIAATEDEFTQMQNLYQIDPKKIVVIPPGVDTSHFYPISSDEAKDVIGVPQNENMILFVGRIEPLKGVDKIIHAIAELQKSDVLSKCPHYLIIIGGDADGNSLEINKEMGRLKNLCKELNVENLVLFLGKKDQESLPYYYSAAEVVVVPSYYESFGMVALEAMACGTPVIATQVGGLPFLVKDGITGFIVPNDDPLALEKALTKLMCKSDLRNQMSLNSQKYAQTYSWDLIITKIIKQYQELLV
jgi:D-inositol-3-phosphate glycosyltransferase